MPGFQWKFCINGTCTNGAPNTSTAAYTDFSSTIDFADDTKTGADDYEIGVETTQARAVRVTAIETDITYTPPADGQRRIFISKVVKP